MLNNLRWLVKPFQDIYEPLFIEHPEDLAFAAIIGTALTIFSLTHAIKIPMERDKLWNKIIKRQGFTPSEITQYNIIRKYADFLKIVQIWGLKVYLFFVSHFIIPFS